MSTTTESHGRTRSAGMATHGDVALVLDGETRAALAVTRSLGRAGVRVRVGAASRWSLAGSSRHAAERLRLPAPLADPEGFARALLREAERHPGVVWFPVTDASLMIVNSVREQLAGVILPFPSSEALEVAWDKARLLETAAAAGLAGPPTLTPATVDEVRDLAPGLTYPVILKPRRSRHRGPEGIRMGEVRVIRSAAELPEAWETEHRRVPAPLIQEFIPGYGLGVFVLADHGRILARFAHRRLREKPPEGGVSVLRASIPVPPEVIAPTERLLARLGWHGVGMVEFRVDERNGALALMEINPRFWGSLQLAIDAGVDFPSLLFTLARGTTPAVVTGYKSGVRSRWFLGDLDHLLIVLARGGGGWSGVKRRLTALGGFLNLLAGRLEVMRPGDPLPGWHEAWSWARTLLDRARRS